MSNSKRYWVYRHEVATGDIIETVGVYDELGEAMSNLGDIATLNNQEDVLNNCFHIVDYDKDGTSIWVGGPKPSLCIPRR